MLYSVAKPFLSDRARGNMVLHRKGEWEGLYKEVRRNKSGAYSTSKRRAFFSRTVMI